MGLGVCSGGLPEQISTTTSVLIRGSRATNLVETKEGKLIPSSKTAERLLGEGENGCTARGRHRRALNRQRERGLGWITPTAFGAPPRHELMHDDFGLQGSS